ncbi:MAG: SMP-30/gluconolactonase/LRE family protein [Mesorhizobium sp.]|uniref:SMP-30/gluconolactonase/LRE family protein n=1 Tax=Mesorhizobium sp. TaxID=1871066 RepID=UPI000FE8AB57|nr:SMP-30/gluconolactonase/LRE family protein [Mesorhizobium sp.]RWI50262.1 MAG: SMP-30/gluconolactonase/LRE family protein [Mesorhizobium sp.]
MARGTRSGLKTALAAIVLIVIVAPALAFACFVVLVTPPGKSFHPETWTPAALRPFPEAITSEAAPVPIGGKSLFGPEDIAIDVEGRLYTGTRDGFIWRMTSDGGAERFAEVGGRPLGLSLLPDGRLIVANHGRGLQQVTPDGAVSVLAAEADGRPILFANDLDISADGIVHLSDSSWRYNTATLGDQSSSYLFPDMIDGRASGRVIAYDMATGETRVVLDGLYFPNGIALTADQRTLWIAESNRYRILALDLANPPSPTVIVDNLPGTPDNLNRASDGTMLLAFYDRVPVVDSWILPNGIARQIIARLPVRLFVNEEEPLGGSVLALDASGRALALQTGLSPAPTTVVEHGGRWYLGALLGQPVRYVEAGVRQP